jgi:uncharacterized membrane protein YeiH
MLLASTALTVAATHAAPAALAASASALSTLTTATPSALTALVESTVPSAVAGVLPSMATTTAPVTQTSLAIPVYLEVSAAFAGALAGALVGVDREFDLIGVTALAVFAGLGGGIIRDVLLQKYGIYALQNPRVLIAALVAALLGFFFFTAARRARPLLFLIDALSLGMFCVLGSDKALLAGLTFIPAILLGTITSVGGGVIRDVLTNQTPQVLRPGGFYATASVTGATLYVLMVGWLGIVKPVAMVFTVVVVVSLRLLSEWLGWQSPTPTDLGPTFAAMPRHVIRTGNAAVMKTLEYLGMPVLRAPAATPEETKDDEAPVSGSGTDEGSSAPADDWLDPGDGKGAPPA